LLFLKVCPFKEEDILKLLTIVTCRRPHAEFH